MIAKVVVTALLAALLGFAGTIKVVGVAQSLKIRDHLGVNPVQWRLIGALELACALLYLIPRTAVFGPSLLPAYLGGAVVTHARIGDPMWVVPVISGILVWVALLLRQPRLRALVLSPR